MKSSRLSTLRGLLAGALLLLPVISALALEPGKPQNLTSPDKVPAGLAKSDWTSIRAAYEAGRHAFQPVEGGWQAHNPGQQWTTRFDGRGFLATPRDGAWTWGLELTSYGFGDAQTPVGATPPVVAAEGQRLSCQWDGKVQEWWVNDQRGLEHGYTVKERPAQTHASELSFLLTTRGSLTPRISDDAKGVLFQDASGATVVNYTGLKVWDADGKVLASRFEKGAAAGSVRLLVAEAGARYPITIDPIAQQAYLKSEHNGEAWDDQFGSSVAVSGDTVVVGATQEDGSATGVNGAVTEGALNAGAAYVFVRSGTTWSQQAYLKASNTGTDDRFGESVAVSGDTVVVGAPRENGSATGVNGAVTEGASSAGAAYVFVRSGTTWSQQAYLKASNTGTDDRFGESVAVSGDTVVVGAPYEDGRATGVNGLVNEGALDAGAAYVFVRSGTTWSQQAYLKAGNTGAGDRFGWSVAVSGDTVVVGAPREDSSATGVNGPVNERAPQSGAAYVFVRSGTTWSQQAYLKAGNTGAADNFGWSVAVSGDTVVVGADGEAGNATGVNGTVNDSAFAAGAAYVFVRSGTTWGQQAYLKASNTERFDSFGYSVAVSGDTVVVGAPGEAGNATGVNGPVNEGALAAGAAYVFVRSGTTWSQQAYLKASNTETGDRFGWSVAVSGDTVVVGAPYEDWLAPDVNGMVSVGAATDSGAAYAFVRNGTTWTQQAYLKASHVSVTDHFGWSVAVSGDTVVVGAPYEDGRATGVNGPVTDRVTLAGAAYVFVRSGTTWSQQAYLKAGNTGAGDNFGWSVAMSGDTVVVGAPEEDGSATGVNGPVNEGNIQSGAAYVFVRSGTTWSQQAYLKASNTGVGDSFGWLVAVSGDTVVVGAPYEDGAATGVNGRVDLNALDAGAAYVFARSGTTWSQQAYLKASNTGAEDQFGRSVAVSGDTVVVGAPEEDGSATGANGMVNDWGFDTGAAYVFVRSGTTWSQQAYLKASNTADYDDFGYSVAVSGDTVVVGAPQDDGSATGVNGPVNESAAQSGAAYVFVRSGTTWSQQAYLKASNTGAEDQFGRSVAVSGDTAVVGAALEDGSATGANGMVNDSGFDAGAAYMFVRSGTTWSQQAYLKASNTGAYDAFGFSVAVSGDTVVVGAPGEDGSAAGVNGTVDEWARSSGAAYIFTGLGPTYNDWIASTGLTGNDALPLAAPHGDGVANLLKWAFNLSGAAADARILTPGTGTAGLPVISVAGTASSPVLRVEFLRRKTGGLIYTPQRISGLSGPWLPLTDTPTVTSLDATWERVVYEEPVTGERWFARVQVALP